MNWSNWGIPGILTGAVACAAALIVFRTAPGRQLNRQLTLLLLMEGVYVGCSVGLVFMAGSAASAFALGVVGTAVMAALPFQYLSFLGVSLQTPLIALFRPRVSVVVLGVVGFAAMALVFLRPGMFVSEPYSPGWAAWNFQLVEMGVVFTQLHGAGSLFGLIAALHAYSRTPHGSAARDRAKWFAIAFGTRDAYIGIIQVSYAVLRPIPFWGDFLYNPGFGLAYLVYVVLLSYGVLRAQLFDIDLKIKVALARSTVVSLIAGAFFVGSEVLESVVPVEGTLLGLVTAGLVVAALRPVQRLSERLVAHVMPGVQPTPSYVDARKAEVYAAAYEAAVIGGPVSAGDRALLQRLLDQLGMAGEEAAVVEQSVAARSGTTQ